MNEVKEWVKKKKKNEMEHDLKWIEEGMMLWKQHYKQFNKRTIIELSLYLSCLLLKTVQNVEIILPYLETASAWLDFPDDSLRCIVVHCQLRVYAKLRRSSVLPQALQYIHTLPYS